MITGYHYINLAKRKDRDLFMRYTLAAMHFEKHEINRFEGIDGRRYKNVQTIARAASKEFRFLRLLTEVPIEDIHGPVEANNPPNIAIQWTWCRLLKMLSKTLEKNEYAICGTDEIALKRLKGDFQRIIERIDDIDILQVCWGHVNHDKMNSMPTIEVEKHPIHGNMRLVQGIGGTGDQLLMLNKAGATRWLNWIAEKPQLFSEIQPARRTQNELIGFYATPNTDEFYLPVPTEVGGSDRIGVIV